MENEKPKTEEKKQAINPILEESRAIAERIEKAAAEAKAQADRLEQLRSEQLLSGTAGIRPPTEEPKVETAKEYAERIMGGKIEKK
jgi:phage protein D